MKSLRLIIADIPRHTDIHAETPVLNRLLARGAPLAPPVCLSAALGELFGLDSSLPLAPYTLAMDGLEPGDAWWMRADPVCLRTNLDHLLLDPTPMNLTPEECGAILNTLNRHFAQDGLEFLAPTPDRWYLRLAGAPGMTHIPPDAAIGRRLSPAMYAGSAAPLWQSRLAEAQMLLHDHAVNAAREERGLPVVNSLWFWGAGQYLPLSMPAHDRIYATHPTAAALCRAAGIKIHATASLDDFLPHAGHGLVVLTPPHPTSRTVLQHLQSAWLNPALQRLRTGRLGYFRLDWIDGETASVSLIPWQAWRIWKRLAPLPWQPTHD